ncbi:MAG: hypothetical protein KGL39_51415 [Patescibacteria group bacterium]|nr:hypothetical protein [Patescibacteria group bacterium]
MHDPLTGHPITLSDLRIDLHLCLDRLDEAVRDPQARDYCAALRGRIGRLWNEIEELTARTRAV